VNVEDLVAIYKFVPKTDEGRKMVLQEYEPGEHNPPGYALAPAMHCVVNPQTPFWMLSVVEDAGMHMPMPV
jgi:hypothetical protein